MSEKNNKQDAFLFVGTPDDNVTDADYSEASSDIFYMNPLDDEDAEEYIPERRLFSFKRKKTKQPRVRIIKKHDEDTWGLVKDPELTEAIQTKTPAEEKPAEEKAPEAKPEKKPKPEKKVNEKKTAFEALKPVKKEKAQKPVKVKSEKPVKTKTEKPVKVKTEKKPNGKYSFILTLTFKLFLICTIVAAMLAIVNAITAPIIAENQFAEKRAIIEEFFPDMSSVDSIEITKDGISAVYLIEQDGETVGYCADVISTGFSGDMNMIVGVDAECNIKGIKIISHAETPGFGTKVVEDTEYLAGYNNMGKPQIILGVDIDAVSGVTSSSRTVNNGVNMGLSVYPDVFGELPEKTETPEVAEKLVVTEEEAMDGLYGWIEDLEPYAEYEGETPFEKLIPLKAGGVNIGFVAHTTVSTEFESIKLLVATYFGQVHGVRVLDYDGEGFEKLAENPEYFIENYKAKTSFAYGTDIPVFEEASAEAEAVSYGVANVLRYYPTYLEIAENLTEVETDE